MGHPSQSSSPKEPESPGQHKHHTGPPPLAPASPISPFSHKVPAFCWASSKKISALPPPRVFSPLTSWLPRAAKYKQTGQTTPLAPETSQPLVLLRNKCSPEQVKQQCLFPQGILYCKFSPTSKRWRTPGYKPDCRLRPATRLFHISLALESSQEKGLHLCFCFIFPSGLLIPNQRTTPTRSGGCVSGDHSVLPQEEQLQSTQSYLHRL